MQTKLRFLPLILIALSCWSVQVSADGNSIDKVYHPYVMPMETELEWRTVIQPEDDEFSSQQRHRFGVGASFIENLFTEVYLIGEKSSTEDFKINSIELEAILQLTEQGEYAADWGVLFELSRDFERNIVEFATALLVEKEWGRWVGALNAFIEFERRDELNNEIETIFAMQMRYRYSRLFEPALELYQNQDTLGLGPVAMGDVRMGRAKKLHWEVGVIFGLQSSTPEQTVRALLEYEF